MWKTNLSAYPEEDKTVPASCTHQSPRWFFCFNHIITSCTFFLSLFVCICDAVLFSRPGKCGRCLTNFVTFVLVFVSVSVKIQPKPGRTSSTGSQMSYQNIGKVIPNQPFLPNNFSLHLKTKRKVLVASNDLYISCGVWGLKRGRGVGITRPASDTSV